MEELNLLADHNTLSVKEVETRSKAILDLLSLIRVKDSQLPQRSNVGWLKDEDANLGFFHASIKCRNIRNYILPLNNVK